MKKIVLLLIFLLFQINESVATDLYAERAKDMNYSCKVLSLDEGDKGYSESLGAIVGLYQDDLTNKMKAIGVTSAHSFWSKGVPSDLPKDSRVVCSDSYYDAYERFKQGNRREILTVNTAIVPKGFSGNPLDGKDICLFTTDFFPENLLLEKIDLYNGSQYISKRNISAFGVGYGDLFLDGNRQPLGSPYERRRGFTTVNFYPDFKGTSCFLTLLRAANTYQILGTDPVDYSFLPVRQSLPQKFKHGDEFYCFSYHNKQVSFGRGFSGSPLIFKTSVGYCLAGVYSTGFILGAQYDDKPQPTPPAHRIEAVGQYPWLNGVISDFMDDGFVSDNISCEDVNVFTK
jgi:hypothetical protein